MQDERFIHIIMEKCQGGDLFDKIIKDGITFSEKMASQIIGNILDAVDYLHERNICHRDLKVSELNAGWVLSAYHSSSYI
jgi:calcium-dependent protein kinase